MDEITALATILVPLSQLDNISGEFGEETSFYVIFGHSSRVIVQRTSRNILEKELHY